MKKEKKTDPIVVEFEQKIGELTAGWQRTQADFVNYKKQAADDKVKYCRSANANLVYDLLPVLDNFQLAAKHVPESLKDDNWAQGIKQIEKQFEDILSLEGLERIETVGTKFDPNFHEAIEHIKSDKPEDEIVEEILSGYKFDSEVIRPARVKVAKGVSTESNEPE